MTEIGTLGEGPGKVRVICQRKGTHHNSTYSLPSPPPVWAKNEYQWGEYESLMGVHGSVSCYTQSGAMGVHLPTLNSGH